MTVFTANTVDDPNTFAKYMYLVVVKCFQYNEVFGINELVQLIYIM